MQIDEHMSLYATLFKSYSSEQFKESSQLFYDRHRRWGFAPTWFRGKKCLDAGCGGGRYTKALKDLGADVYAFDVDGEVAKVAMERTGIPVLVASATHIPFPDETFDYVICMGVLNHVDDPDNGFRELARVLKQGGTMVFGVYGDYGLRWWFGTDIWRYSLAKVISFETLNKVFSYFGVPANKRYAILDNLYVRYLHRFTEKQVRKKWLSGFCDVRRHPYERYDYRRLFNRIMYGVGWIQFTAVKCPKTK